MTDTSKKCLRCGRTSDVVDMDNCPFCHTPKQESGEITEQQISDDYGTPTESEKCGVEIELEDKDYVDCSLPKGHYGDHGIEVVLDSPSPQPVDREWEKELTKFCEATGQLRFFIDALLSRTREEERKRAMVALETYVWDMELGTHYDNETMRDAIDNVMQNRKRLNEAVRRALQ